MAKSLLEIVNILAVLMIVCLPFLKTKTMGLLAVFAISIQTVINFFVAYLVFKHGTLEYNYAGTFITGLIPVRIDYLSAWFILVLSFTFLTGAWYGLHYMKKYLNQPYNLTLHAIAFILAYTTLIDICIFQNGFVILVVWEIMALSSFVLIIFEHHKSETIRAGINFLIQSHICILFLTLAFIWVRIKTGSFDLHAISEFSTGQPVIACAALFTLFFFGFAIKAGFVPFHTWLPLAHPVAPSHISGIMSGVIIKIGIYGILRILLLIHTDMAAIGYFLLFFSVITGVYGVMLAIIQHNLKKLLAYHSIENIGIIGIGIGVGCFGIHFQNEFLLMVGFGGCLLHVLNHSLFKSLLFFSAGNIYLAKHSMNIEEMGGLIKKIPKTAYLFLIGSLAICGLPPFNGFVSEYLIYSGLYQGIQSNHFIFILFMLFSILGLVLIGGLALLCFTKAFGMVFLGNARKADPLDIRENRHGLFPLYPIALMITGIGLFPIALQPMLNKISGLFVSDFAGSLSIYPNTIFHNISAIGWYAISLVLLGLIIYLLRFLISRNHAEEFDNTWGCGYTGNTGKMQYTASSFIRMYRKLAEPVLLIKKKKADAEGLYPQRVEQSTHPADKIENSLIDKPLNIIRRFLNRFVFLQNGNIQAYILYGFLFVGLAVLLPVLIDKLMVIIKFLNQL